nr:hypothetical protein [Tanacetum cinerariifolium]
MTNPITTSTSDSQMYNNIIAAGSRDHPPLLTPGRYAQWRSHFMRYIDTKDNCEALKKCLEEGPYVPSTVIIPAKPATKTSEAVEGHSEIETLANISHTTTRFKGKEIAKPITPSSELASKEDSDPEQAQRDKDMQKDLVLIAKYVKDNQISQFGNQRIVIVDGTREPIDSQQVNWPKDTYKEVDEQELEAHYSFMVKIQEVLLADLVTDAEPLEKVDRNVIPDSPDMCDNDDQADQNAEECDDERAALANLIANLTLDIEENKKIL